MVQPSIVVVGSSNRDLVVYSSELPRVGETLRGSDFKINFGGKGANQAVQAARLGAHVTMITKLGKDTNGTETLKNYSDNGIDTKYIFSTDQAPSGVALISVDSHGNNSIIIVAGANDLITSEEIQSARALIKQAKILICQLEIPAEMSIVAMKIAREEGVKTILNTAPILPEMPAELFKYADIICANETELERMTDLPVNSIQEITDAATKLFSKGVGEVIVTLGERGSLYISKDGKPKHVNTEGKVQACDTTGAGDSFIGGLAYCLASGKDVEYALRAANYVAGLSVQKLGTQPSYSFKKDVPSNILD